MELHFKKVTLGLVKRAGNLICTFFYGGNNLVGFVK